MGRIAELLRSLCHNRRGGTAIEYGLIAALVVVAIIASISALGSTTTTMWGNVHDKVKRVTD